MKKSLGLIVIVVLISVMMSAVSAFAQQVKNTPEPTGNEVLVVYFSATGTTEGIAETIAEITKADIYEILAADEYSDADLNWNDRNSRSTIEQNDPNSRPEIGSDPINLEGYKKIFIGYPIWWQDASWVLDAFVEANDFTGKTVITFCTSQASGYGESGAHLAEKAGTGNWIDGINFFGTASDEEISAWLETLK